MSCALRLVQVFAVMTAFPLIIVFVVMMISLRRWLIGDEADKNHVATNAKREVHDDLRHASVDGKGSVDGKKEAKTKA